jgi:hypothetical protein
MMDSSHFDKLNASLGKDENRDTMQPATWEIVGCCLARFRVQVEG